MENNIQILRLKSGYDIIASISDKPKGKLLVKHPMVFDIRAMPPHGKKSLSMGFWLPVQVMKDNEVIMATDDVLAIFDPSPEFQEYYNGLIEQFMSDTEEDQEDNLFDDEEDIVQTMDALKEAKTHNRVH